MKRTFLEKFFPISKTIFIRKEICGIRKQSRKTLYQFNKLRATYPLHQINEQLLFYYFYEGLMLMDRSMIDTTSGGVLMDKTPTISKNFDFQYGM
ncbi:hypothetical protein CR513_51216, partial [Mucuna pruriens]